jgi:NADH:ubiquinone oxidoreductase subunit K
MNTLASYLVLAAILFFIGLLGAMTRRHAIIVLICIELMLNAANLNFIAFWRFSPHPELMLGPLFVLFSIAIAGAEASVGLALVIAIYRFYKSVDVEKMNALKG